MVLISHGNDFGDEAAFGRSDCVSFWASSLTAPFCTGQALGKLGRAHCKIAQLQEDYADRFRDTFLTSLATLEEVVRDYSVQRKKLDSRR